MGDWFCGFCELCKEADVCCVAVGGFSDGLFVLGVVKEVFEGWFFGLFYSEVFVVGFCGVVEDLFEDEDCVCRMGFDEVFCLFY